MWTHWRYLQIALFTQKLSKFTAKRIDILLISVAYIKYEDFYTPIFLSLSLARRVYDYSEGLYRGLRRLRDRLETVRSLITADTTPPYRDRIDPKKARLRWQSVYSLFV